jgi:P27 family predicted phage terminase small subunit
MPGPFPKSKKIPDTTDEIPIPKGCPAKVKPYFSKIVKELQELKLASQTDSSIVYSLAIMQLRRHELTKQLLKDGETFQDSNGNIRKNPASSLLNDVIASCLRLENQLGLDPRSRKAITGYQEHEKETENINDLLDKMTG